MLGLGGIPDASDASFVCKSFSMSLDDKVREPYEWIKSLDNGDPCWELFTYQSMLMESRYLPRALQCLRKATGITRRRRNLTNIRHVGEDHSHIDLFEDLHQSLETVDFDTRKATEFVKNAIDMVISEWE